ncbi:hypothetical protein [Microbulbifer sp. TRSA007]|uniref:hypothetical protein n=1 Tax=Microbulbifer sp. TRSA007 TaxID=3243384 RepID=UPI00403A131B
MLLKPKFCKSIIVIAAASVLSACDNSSSSLNGVSKTDVCKAAIQYLSSMNGDRNEAIEQGGMVRINQTRASDGMRFYYDCKISGNRISWRMNQADGSMGRWRDGEYDPKVTLSVSSGRISIREN